MSSPEQTLPADTTTRQFDYIIAAVIERGYDEKEEDIDDYAALLGRFEFRKLVTFQLYDSYFPPKRHEFELQLLSSLVDSVTSIPTVAFFGGAVVGGVVGNASYDVLKRLVSYIISKLTPIKRSHSSFREIEMNADRVMKFFEKNDQAETEKICKDTDIPADKIEPLLRLLGFRCRRKGKRRVWILPAASNAGRKKKANEPR